MSAHVDADVRVDGSTPWPPHAVETVPWAQAVRGGTKEDRMLSSIDVSIPPLIALLDVSISPDLENEMAEALREITVLDRAYGPVLSALGTMLLRTESVASSRIEGVTAKTEDFARALHGSRANSSATSMAAATSALSRLMDSVNCEVTISWEMLAEAHRALMIDDPSERAYAGRIRDMQNWIGGSDHSPRGALYVPPSPESVTDLLDDLMSFVSRTDVPVLVQAAIAHAQFESIHPFTDGNGRIGRALMNAVLRHREATSSVVVPIASRLVGNRERYFNCLNEYRQGNPEPMMRSLSSSSLVAATEAQITAARLAEFPTAWRDTIGRVRRGSATDRMLDWMPGNPIFTVDDLEQSITGPTSSLYSSVDRLRGVGIVRPLTERKRDQVWGVSAVLAELDDLGMRIGTRA